MHLASKFFHDLFGVSVSAHLVQYGLVGIDVLARHKIHVRAATTNLPLISSTYSAMLSIFWSFPPGRLELMVALRFDFEIESNDCLFLVST